MPAAADPDLALALAKAAVELYSGVVERLLRDVAARLARGITGPDWATAKLLEVDALRRAALVELEALTAAVPEAIEDAVTAGWSAGASTAAREVGVAATATTAVAPQPVAALVRETVQQVTSTHPAILRTVVDGYRDVIAETAAPDVLTGTRTRVQAAQQAMDRFAARGITGFTDSRGRSWSLESYTEMATRTAVGRAQVAGSLDRYEAAGRDLVLVSDAPQECAACRPWEGKVLSITGNTPMGTSVTGGGGARFMVRGTVAAAQRGGLHHPNCRHKLGAFVPGLTRRMTDTADPDGDRARQQQRYLERGLRAWKRREAAALTDEDRRRAKAHRQEWSSRLQDHVDEHDGLRRQRSREGVTAGRAR